MIYAYGICEAASADPPPRGRGLGDARLRTLRRDGLAAVYSRHRSLQPRPSRMTVLAHERVLEAIMQRGPVLPLRFGTQLGGEEELAAVLEERQDELGRALERVRGSVELGLRVLRRDRGQAPRPSSRAGDEASGREYLLARVAEKQEADRVARALHTPLAALAHAAHIEERPAPPALLVGSYLVEESRVPAFRARAGELAAELPDVEAVVTGPWPPYSFAGEETT